MRKRFDRALWGLPVLVLLLSGFTLPGDTPARLTDRIDQILFDEQADAAFWGIYVQDLTTGRVLVERNMDKSFMPASNQKLITTAAALDLLGPDFRYETRLHLDGAITDGILTGI
ncbi:MAG: hypothetical protein RhofKO_05570 [Rhodothermales bacterium]